MIWLTASFVCALATLGTTAQAAGPSVVPAPLLLPEPAAPEPRAVEERGASPVYYRYSPVLVRPSARLAIGAHVRPGAEGLDSGVAFAFDALGGASVLFGRNAKVALLSEAGYHYVGFSEHFASLGAGPLLLGFEASRPEGARREVSPAFHSIGLIPRALYGTYDGNAAIGARAGLLLSVYMFSFELAHQIVRTEGRSIHELRLVLGGAPWVGSIP